ncbi:hypothetical protein [Cellulosilyticum sp. I15G10I2]|uniref:hypothetical protein n=1 Tax=Cellulosilyticum sp. I15G10I2 TaxID=1892843 RepID=UPI00085C0D1C|nr:hypothetical protein [Cellulosilyticum sp. I15G10I2]
MVLDEILNLLKTNSELNALLNPTVIDNKIYMYDTNKDCNCIVYKFIPLTSNGIKAQARLEITCISKDYIVAEQILEQVKKILLTIGSKHNQLNSIKNVSLNGGGSLKDSDLNTFQLKGFFILTYREGR